MFSNYFYKIIIRRTVDTPKKLNKIKVLIPATLFFISLSSPIINPHTVATKTLDRKNGSNCRISASTIFILNFKQKYDKSLINKRNPHNYFNVGFKQVKEKIITAAMKLLTRLLL